MLSEQHPNGWEITTLNDIAIKDGYGLVDGPFGSNLPASDYTSTGVPVIRGSNLSLGSQRFVDDEFVFVSPQTAKRLERSIAKPGDIIFTKKGTLGQTGIVPDSLPYKQFLTSSNQMKLSVNQDVAFPLFIYYYVSSPASREKIIRDSEVTGVPKTNLAYLRTFPVSLPPLAEQRTIAGILGALDDKIELNRRMNRTLESMARAVFRQWFVESEEVESWEIGRLGDLCDVTIGGDWGEEREFEDSVPVICLRGVDLDNLRKDGYSEDAPIRWIKKSSLEKRQLSDCDILIAGSGIGPVGKPLWVSTEMLKAYPHPVIYSNFVKRFRAKLPEYAVYLDRILFNMRESNEIWDYINGTSIPNLNDKDLLAYYQISIPPYKLVKDFYEYVRPIYTKLYNKESRTLASLRDSLLPKLMRGEVMVKEET